MKTALMIVATVLPVAGMTQFTSAAEPIDIGARLETHEAISPDIRIGSDVKRWPVA